MESVAQFFKQGANLPADLSTGWLWIFAGIGVFMYVPWTIAYVLTIKKCFKDRSYGIPMIPACFNLFWEFCFTVNLFSNLGILFQIFNATWLVPDLIIAWQVFRYGQENQTIPFLKKHFRAVGAFTFVGACLGLYYFSMYFGDINGVGSSITFNFIMSILFIFMLFNRPDLRGLSYGAAWFKMIGTLAGCAFLRLWWPLQFDENGRHLRNPDVHEPLSYDYLLFLLVFILIVDCMYIYLHKQRQRELAAEAVAA